jgi:hypothetical protein
VTQRLITLKLHAPGLEIFAPESQFTLVILLTCPAGSLSHRASTLRVSSWFARIAYRRAECHEVQTHNYRSQ